MTRDFSGAPQSKNQDSRLGPASGRPWTAAILAALGVLLAALEPGAAELLPEWPAGGNIRVLQAKPLSAEAAAQIYEPLLDQMVEAYKAAGLADTDYRNWQRLTPFPRLSDAHGMRYVNVYVNATAANVMPASRDAPLPEGARIMMDSFSVIVSGATSRGPLFLMEKMPLAFWPEAGDWRYTLIMPNGKLFGTSKGEGNAAVQYCADCHAQAAERDHVFGFPAPATPASETERKP